MQKDIHPGYYKITGRLPDGTEMEFYSTCGKSNETVVVPIEDRRKHPAWSGDAISKANQDNVTMTKFKEKFGAVGFFAAKPAEETSPIQE